MTTVMVFRARAARPGRSHARDLGQHNLESAALAARLAADAGIAASDLVVEFGAGTGTLTAAIADCGARVLAVEVDPVLAAGLAQRFARTNAVTIFEGDAVVFPLPATPYRVFANPPFSRTSALLRHLLDAPAVGPVRADLVVQWQVARALARPGDNGPIDLVGASWAPWWCFRRARRLPAEAVPPGAVGRRRGADGHPPRAEPAPGGGRAEFMGFVRERFAASGSPPARGAH